MKTKILGARTAVVTAAVLSLLVMFASCKKNTDKTVDIIGQECFTDSRILPYFTSSDQIEGFNPKAEEYEFEDFYKNGIAFNEEGVRFHYFKIKDVFYAEDGIPYFYVTGRFGKETRSVYVESSNLCFSCSQKKSFVPAYFEGKQWAPSALITTQCFLTKDDGDYKEPKNFLEYYEIVDALIEYYEDHKSEENLEKIQIFLNDMITSDPKNYDYPFKNPICTAINAEDSELAELLIREYSQDICSIASTTDGLTPAMTATLKGNEDVLDALMKKRIDLSVCDFNGKTFSDYIEASSNNDLKKYNAPELNAKRWQEIVKSFTDYYSSEDFKCPVIDMQVERFSEYKKDKKIILIPGACIMNKDGKKITVDSYVEVTVLDFQENYTVSPSGTNDYFVLCKSKDLGEFVVLGEYLAISEEFRSFSFGDKPQAYNVYAVTFRSPDDCNRCWHTMFYVDRRVNLCKPLFNEYDKYVETGFFNNYDCLITEFAGETMIFFTSSSGVDEEYEETAYFILPMDEDSTIRLIDRADSNVSSTLLTLSEENNEINIYYAYNKEYREWLSMMDDFEIAGYGRHYYYDPENKTFIHDGEKDELLDSVDW